MGTTESILSTEETEPPLDGRGLPSGAVPHQTVGRVAQQGPQRPRPRPPPTNVDTLKGILLGLPSSGKRTLLQRLQGRDPFDKSRALPQVNGKVIVPYRPPSSSKDRIRLQVQIPESLREDEKVDFAIVLINPRHDPKHVAPYLDNVIQSLLLQAGYPPPNYKKKKKKKNATEKLLDPFCLCLMLNFRDIRDDKKDLIRESDLEAAASNILEGYPDNMRKRIVLEYGTTSLLNCFGLGTLHRFIYSSHLQRKQAMLEKQLLQVQQELEKSTEADPQQSYDEFLKLLPEYQNGNARKPRGVETQKPVVAVATKSVSSNSATTNGQRDAHSVDHGDSNEEQDGEEESARERKPKRDSSNRRERRRQIMDTTNQSPQTHERRKIMDATSQSSPTHARKTADVSSYHNDAQSALEAFFADDDDAPPPSPKIRTDNTDKNGSDDSDDDDDFYYDEGGTRRGAHIMDIDDEEDDEIESAPPAPPRPKPKQPKMPSIEEMSDVESDDLSVGDSDKLDTKIQREAPDRPSEKQPPPECGIAAEASTKASSDASRKKSESKRPDDPADAEKTESLVDEKKVEHDSVKDGDEKDMSTAEERLNRHQNKVDGPDSAELSGEGGDETVEAAKEALVAGNETEENQASARKDDGNDESCGDGVAVQASAVHSASSRPRSSSLSDSISGDEKRMAKASPNLKPKATRKSTVSKGQRSASISSDEEFMEEAASAPTSPSSKPTATRNGTGPKGQRSTSISSDEEFMVETTSAPTSPASKSTAGAVSRGQRSLSISSDEEFMVESISGPASPASKLAATRNSTVSKDTRSTSISSDEEFMVVTEPSPATPASRRVTKPEQPSSKATNTSSPSKSAEEIGISAAALAAIAAAQREAELMLQQPPEEEETMKPRPKKPKKKKKDGSQKKKKKKKDDPERAEKKKKKREKQERKSKDVQEEVSS